MLKAVLPMILLALNPAVAPSQEPRSEDATTVTVKGQKKPVAKKLDKTVYDVSGNPTAANGSVQDVLQTTPEVSVTADGQIAVKGNSQVTVLINGKPSAVLSGPDRAVALQTMNGSDVASIEVITNPSAAYNANGGAIVNIVLKKDRKPGLHGQVRGSVSDQGLWNVAVSGDATRGRLSLHGTAAFRRDGTLRFRRSEMAWRDLISGATGEQSQSSKVFVRRIVHNASLGFDLDLSDTDTLSGSANTYFRRSRPWFDMLNQVTTETSSDIYHRISYGPNQQSNGGASLSYSHVDGDEVLKITAQHSGTIALVDKSYRDLYVKPQRATEFGRGMTKTARRLNQISADWTRPSAYGQWGVGVDLQQQADDLNSYQASVDPVLGTETADLNISNRYRAATTLNAAYVTDRFSIGPWQWLVGARYEAMTLHLTAVDFDHRTDWQAVNPSVQVRRALGDTAKLTFSFRGSLQRPEPADLNPFTTYLDARNLSRGNPDLTPQRMSAFEMTLDDDTTTLSRSVGVFYRTSRDTVTEARSFIADNILLTSKQNGGQAQSAGLTVSANWMVNANWRVRGDGGVYGVSLRTPDVWDIVHQDGLSGYVNLAVDYTKGRDVVSLDAHAQSAGLTPLGRYGATNSVNITWKRDLSRRLTLTVNASDIFDGSKRTYAIDSTTFRQRGAEHFVARRLYIGMVKKIG